MKTKVPFIMIFIVLFGFSSNGATYTTIANGNWNLAATWQGGSIPPAVIPAGDLVLIRHTVNYDLADYIKNYGTIRIQPVSGTIARLNYPSGKDLFNYSTGKFYVINGSYVQYRFVGGGNTGVPQSGHWLNEAGYVYLENAYVEVAQDWKSNAGGKRNFQGGCLKTGQNYSLDTYNSIDSLNNVCISVGWHGSGNFEMKDGYMYLSYGNRISLHGTSGNAVWDKGYIYGVGPGYDIAAIVLYNTSNQGKISTSTAISSPANNVDLQYYCINTPSGQYEDLKPLFLGEAANCTVARQLIDYCCSPITNTDVPDPNIVKTDNSVSFAPGTPNVYTVTVTGDNTQNINHAHFTDNAPAGTTIVSWSAVTAGGATISSPSGTGNIDVTMDLPVSSTVTFTITVSVPCAFPGNLVNTANVITYITTDSSTDTDQQNIWDGSSGNDWNNPANWSLNLVPDDSPKINAVIPTGVTPYPVINTTGNTAAHLLVQDGASLTINPGNDLSVLGCVEIKAPCGLTLKSDSASGNASFVTAQDQPITYDADGNACVELYLTSCDDNDIGCWHYVSSPVTNAAVGVFDNDYLKSFNEVTGTWSDYYTHSGTPMNVLQGYIVSNPTAGVRTFQGQLNDGTVQKTLARTVTSARPGWNLVGNPYVSEIDLNTTLNWTDVDQVVYYYNQTQGNYRAYIGGPYGFGLGTRYIPSMQGFFVHVYDGGAPNFNNTSGIIRFNDNNRTTTGTVTFYKDLPSDALTLKVQGQTNLYDQLLIYFNDGISANFETEYDAMKLPGAAGSPQLYSVSGDDLDLTIDGRNYQGINTIVPLGFYINAQVSGSYTITAENLESFRPGTTITLEDKKTQTTQELTINPEYTFAYSSNDDPARFFLHFYNPFFGVEDKDISRDLHIYSSGRDVYLKDLTGNPQKGEFFLYNQMGQEISHKKVTDISLNKYTFNLPNGYYIVKVITKDKTYNGKVYLY